MTWSLEKLNGSPTTRLIFYKNQYYIQTKSGVRMFSRLDAANKYFEDNK